MSGAPFHAERQRTASRGIIEPKLVLNLLFS
jgi:hypothetical protein